MSSYLIVDFETTDLPDFHLNPGLSKARVVQFACLFLDDEFTEQASFCSLIKLEDGVDIAPGAAHAHGIAIEDCQKYGVPIKVALALFDSLAQQADFVVAHNMKFEAFLLATECIKAHQPIYALESRQGICTMLTSTDVCKIAPKRGTFGKFKWPKLEEAAKILLNIDMVNAHDALYDCKVTAQLLEFLVRNGHVSPPVKELLSNF